MNKESVGTIDFRYKIEDLYEEVFKHTSFLAKHRGDEQNPHFLRLGSFTRDERFMFEPFLKEGAAKVFDLLDSFTHGLDQGYGVDEYNRPVEKLGKVYRLTDDLITFDDFQSNVDTALSDSEMTAIRVHFGVRFKDGKRIEGARLRGRLRIAYDISYSVAGEETTQTLYYTENAFEFPFVDGTYNRVIYINTAPDADSDISGETFEQMVGVRFFDLQYVGVLNEPLVVGSLVEIETGKGVKTYEVQQPITAADFAAGVAGLKEITPAMQGAVRFTINKMVWHNEPAIRAIDNAIENALINYIIFRWFLYTIPAEAKTYEAMFVDSCTTLQHRLNSQKKPVRRKYFYF